MTDPRNVAHDKKVYSDKEAAGEEIVPDAAETPQPGRKPNLEHHAGDADAADDDGVTSDGGPNG